MRKLGHTVPTSLSSLGTSENHDNPGSSEQCLPECLPTFHILCAHKPFSRAGCQQHFAISKIDPAIDPDVHSRTLSQLTRAPALMLHSFACTATQLTGILVAQAFPHFGSHTPSLHASLHPETRSDAASRRRMSLCPRRGYNCMLQPKAHASRLRPRCGNGVVRPSQVPAGCHPTCTAASSPPT